MTDKQLHIARIVLGSCLLGWFLKAAFFIPYLFSTVFQAPITYNFFPALFLDNTVSLIFYCLPLISIAGLWRPTKLNFILASFILCLSSSLLLLHVNTYNDATFITIFWTSLWLLWFSYKTGSQDEGLASKAQNLAGWIIAVIFIGGFAGKLTPEYTGGEVLYQIFFVQGQGLSPIGILLNGVDPSVQIKVCAWIAKCILAGEGILALSGLIGLHRIFWPAIFIIGIIPLFSTWAILSVLLPLAGLMIAARLLRLK